MKLDVLSEKSNKLITEQQSKLSYLKALKASLLDKAFKGGVIRNINHKLK